MNIYSKKIRWKFILLSIAILIGVGSLYYTNSLVKKLTYEELKKVGIWADATALLVDSTTSEYNFGFLLKIIQYNETVPVIVVDESDNILLYNNFDSIKVKNDKYIRNQLKRIKKEAEKKEVYIFHLKNKTIIYTNDRDSEELERKKERLSGNSIINNLFRGRRDIQTIVFPNPIQYSLPGGKQLYMYYDRSTILSSLTYYPYIQLGLILLFILAAYFAFNTSRKAEQNKVWVGLSKETAHQLGTPTSSLMAWLEILKEHKIEASILNELEKDIIRLNKITERFSKIGSKPKLNRVNIIDVLINAIDYIKSRSSDSIKIDLHFSDNELFVPLNVELFEWVIESLCKNAIDAMEGKGNIDITVTDNTQVLYIDILDTGKGIPKSKFKTVFKPGYTTKERGWGLGLSLTERIIETYHSGKIFVNTSELGKGTKFRIVLNKFA